MIRMQMTKLTIALTAVMTAFSTHAVGQDGISNDEFIFNDDIRFGKRLINIADFKAVLVTNVILVPFVD